MIRGRRIRCVGLLLIICFSKVEGASYLCSATLDTLKGELQELEQTEGSLSFIDQCDEIDKAQMLYAYLKKHYFFHFYPHIWFNYETGDTHIDNQKYRELLKTITSHTPKTLLQQMIFPYGNPQYAERGEGVYLCKMGAGVWQSGVWQAKGKLVIESEKLIDFPFSDQVCKQSYELSKQTQERIKLFFEIEKSNQELSSLPYVQQKEGNKRVFLGCLTGPVNTQQLSTDTHGVMILRAYYDFQNHFHNYQIVFLQQKNLKYKLSPKMVPQYIDLYPYLNQEITMKFYLLPNYLPAAGDNFSECANSWLDAYEIVGV